MKKILFVTGTRADFGKLKPLAVSAIENNFDVNFFITGMHLLDKYGLTKIEVRDFAGDFCYEFLNQRDNDPLEVILSKTVTGFADYLSNFCPDLVVIHGDRIEAVACSLVCATKYVRCAHVEGGELSGTIDEAFRHSISKLAHKHFVSSTKAATTLRRLGEAEQNIFVIGSPELDVHAKSLNLTLEQVKSKYDINFEEYGILVFHPVTSELDTLKHNASILFEAIKKSKKKFVIIKPNNDPGTQIINECIEQLSDSALVRIIPSMRFEYFSILLRNCSLVLGNSSLGVREAPFLGIPSIDVGSRQTNRSSSTSIVNLQNPTANDLILAINKQWNKRFPRSSNFGVGNAAAAFVKVLNEEKFWSSQLQKIFVN